MLHRFFAQLLHPLGLVYWAGRVEHAGWCVVPRPQFLNELVLFPF